MLVDGQRVTIYTAVERPLDEESGQRLADWADSLGLFGMVGSNIIHLRLKEGVTSQQVLEQVEACRKSPLREGIAEVVDRTGLWEDLPVHAKLFIRERGEVCDVFRHLRDPIMNVPRAQFRWTE